MSKIQYTNIQRHSHLTTQEYFALPHKSYSWLKHEYAGATPYFPTSQKMKIGTLVDGLLTDQFSIEKFDNDFLVAKEIAIEIKKTFGELIKHFMPQVCYTAKMQYENLEMETKGKLDWELEKHAVIDLKFTAEKSISGVIKHFGYDNQLWHYAQLAQVKKAYIIAYSSALKKCLPITEINVTGENEFFKQAILKHGK